MHLLRLILRNALRHKLRTSLTIGGIAIAVMAFGTLRTIITSWNAGVESSQANRMVTVHRVSFIFPLPLSYRDRIARVPGVKEVSFANWFSGVYIDQNQFFPRLAIDPETIWDVTPEFIVSDSVKEALKRQRNGCVIGVKIARDYKLKVGDVMNIEGDIYPGKWQMQVVGIYHGRDRTADETQMLFNWHYLDEQLKQDQPGRAGYVGWYILQIENPNDRARIAVAIDNLFANSPAETKTQTEKEFQQSFVSMSGAILSAINVVSFVIIGIILLVLANTMAMTARERIREYAIMRTLGFSTFDLTAMIAGESMLISLVGGAIGLAVTYPICSGIQSVAPTGMFPVFIVETWTALLAFLSAVAAGVVAAAFPIRHAAQMKIVDGLRQFA
jgi:putative ABC transport system permease protein